MSWVEVDGAGGDGWRWMEQLGAGFSNTLTTMYFKLDKGARQSDPISAYLFILVLEIMFNLIKQNKDLHGLTFFDHTFL